MQPDELREHLRLASVTAGLEAYGVSSPRDHAVTLRGLRFHYLDWGNPRDRPVVFLHGGGLTAHTWDLVCMALRNEYHCLAIDLRGHGDNSWATDGQYGIDDIAADSDGFVDELGLNGFVLVGMSLGGQAAIVFASQQPKKPAGLVVVDTGPRIQQGTSVLQPNPGSQRIRDFMSGPAELDSVDGFVERAMVFNPARDPLLLRRSLLHNLHQLPNGRWTWKYDRLKMLERDLGVLETRRDELWQDIKNIQCPVLVVRGGRSDVYSDADAAAFASTLARGRWTRVENAGHTVQGDNPRGLLEAVLPFLREFGSS